MNKLHWGILGTGSIAKRFAKALKTSKSGLLQAVASRGLSKAEAFAGEFGPATAHAGYQALLDDPSVEAVYIALPHPLHAAWAIRAARAGKHILCEKPAGLTWAETEAMIESARENGVFFMEAFMYRCHPQTQRLVEIIRAGEIGQVRLIQATFSFDAGYSRESRLFNNALGGGGILDVGCYCVSMARLVAAASLGLATVEPLAVKGTGWVDPEEGTDLLASALLKFPGNITAQLTTGVQLGLDNHVRIHGSKGSLTLNQPWFAGGKGATLVITRKGQPPETVVTESAEDLYAHEIDLVAQYKDRGQAPYPAMGWEDTLGNMKVLDAWRAELGVVYKAEKRQSMTHPLWSDTLARRSDASMRYLNLAGLAKPVSRLIMGGMSARTAAGQMVLDDYFERGGNAFDTAAIYGEADAALGHWMSTRGVRKDVVVIAKGAHTPHCTPEGITRQLKESLANLQTDHADLYIMHRDNEEVPVGEFVDVLNRHLEAGCYPVFGASNWTLERIEAANDYAARNGLKGFSVLNNQLSLARMVDPVWAGCLSVGDAASLAWLKQRQFPLMSWSSQARGFFTDRAAPDRKEDREMVRCWYATDNFERKRRAAALAVKKGCEEINIALAYVLCQPFPVWTLIGPACIGEVRSCFRALEIQLTPGELRWLNLETEQPD